MRYTRTTKEYPAVGTYEFEEWAKKTLGEIHEIVESYRAERLAAMGEFMDFLDMELGSKRMTEGRDVQD
jgi:hypothetical protein